VETFFFTNPNKILESEPWAIFGVIYPKNANKFERGRIM